MPTTTATLTDRYVETAMRTVPEKQRPDLAAELRASIEDEIEARIAAGDTPDAAEIAVLTELGDPDALAAGYIDRPLWLIGPKYYLTWWRLTKLLWAIVPACVAFAVALGQVLAGESIGTVIGAVVPAVISVIVNIGFWTALVFFIIERSTGDKDAAVVSAWTLDRLPEKKERGAGLSDLVASLVFLALAAGAVIWDQLFGLAYLTDAGGWLPALSPALWPGWILGLLALIVLEALLMTVVYLQGRWTAVTATVNAALNVAFVIPLLWLLSRGELLNPELFPGLIPAGSADTVETVLVTLLSFGAVAIAAWDTIDGFLKARRAR
ncbi:permease prefix domain 1-containing protein [Microbacterium sp. zg.Y1084]|uniref:permease prefix domain 1-containing protein n=1 Tax=Microbacterium sp. zg.Y1084 TaxID=2969667 RepID=UPI00214C2B12|nr:permease prefix domain 1-containing protein [Microbacterium sp. zg.Y1084]MCR2812545.1 permease prefix domain 1-containing protein [Microbacterium sp. zg.Y1084]